MRNRAQIIAALGIVSLICAVSCERSTPEHSAPHVAHWTYDGDTGPQNWGELNPQWSAAADGKQQSPIDITDELEIPAAPVLEPSYKEASLDLKNNGHTVTQTCAPGSSISVAGASYNLDQFHFHHKSEHTVDGEQFDLECHLVHKNADENLLVVGVLFKPGAENPFLAKFWSQLPTTEGAVATSADVSLNVTDLLPSNLAYYHYQGSLTTPPCTEGVKWYVLETPVEASTEQIAAFAKIFPRNFRPVQPLFGRKITSN